MQKLIILITLFLFLSGSYLTAQKFSPPEWKGHWEAYSKTDSELKIATLDVEKLKGKEYTFKVWFKPGFNGPDDQPCPEKTYEGFATWNGANGLITNIKGIGFVYYQETGIINIFHDYSDQELTDLSFCFDAGDLKKVK